jgi:hypothetical protein
VCIGAVAACGRPSHPPPLNDDGAGANLRPTVAASDPPGFGGFGPPVTVNVASQDDPATCAQAAMQRSYVGCDYWPTVVANTVWSIFDYAVVVA